MKNLEKILEFIVLWFTASITIIVLIALGLQWAAFNIILSSALVTALLMLIKKNRTKITASSFYSVFMVINIFRNVDMDMSAALTHIIAPAALAAICIGCICFYAKNKLCKQND